MVLSVFRVPPRNNGAFATLRTAPVSRSNRFSNPLDPKAIDRLSGDQNGN
jgi:hypothetical protein